MPSPFARSAGAMAAIVFAMFADVLVSPGTIVLGAPDTDMFLQFVAWREFGFAELGAGNLALWNPHVYAGAPYFGGVQAALLYPVNLLLLVLPLAAAINWTIAINVWLLGVGMHLWASQRGLRPLACFVAGVLAMFSGPHFTHVYAGHPVNMAAMAWAPFILLSVDGVIDAAIAPSGSSFRRVAGWVLLGMAALALQILAGHPQYVFYTAVAVGCYAALRLWRAAFAANRRGAAVAIVALGAVFAGGGALSAVQLLTALAESRETIRALPMPFAFAAMFGFPPENVLTLLNPFVFGDMVRQRYWGRCYLWEMSLFVGVTGFVLAIFGAAYGEKDKRRFSLVMIALLLVLALGVHTPLFRVFYDWVPGFASFRGVSKFIFPAGLFLVMLAGVGFDRLMLEPLLPRSFVLGSIAGFVLLLLAAVAVWRADAAGWQVVMRAIQATGETYLPPQAIDDAGFADAARAHAAESIAIAAATGLALTGLLHALRFSPHAFLILAAVAALEVAWFARHVRATFDSRAAVLQGIDDFLAEHPGDYRILNIVHPNSAMSMGARDLWGADPGVLRRYAELVTWTQGGDPNAATQYVGFTGVDPLYSMLRLRFAFIPQAGTELRVDEVPNPMPRLQLIGSYRVATERDVIFAAMRESSFDPRREAILEQKPQPEPQGAEGKARIVEEGTDEMTIEAEVPAPALLLVTDTYASGWRAISLPGSVQERYAVQPANYVLRAIPLAAGHHRLRLEYAPRAFTVGTWVSASALLVYLAALAVMARRAPLVPAAMPSRAPKDRPIRTARRRR